MDTKKKIVIVSPAYPYRGGQALIESFLFKNLSKLGYDCSTISFKLLYPSILFPGVTQFDNSKTIFFSHTKNIYQIINSINPLSWIQTSRKISAIKPVLVIFVWWTPFLGLCYGTIAFLLKLFTSSKIAFLIENYIPHERKWVDKILTKVGLSQSDFFICQSSYINDQVKFNYPNKDVFQLSIPAFNFFNLNQHTQQSAREFLKISSQYTILFFGLIRPYKGLSKLIAAHKHILKMNSSITLLIVGECYEDKEKYRKLIIDEGIKNNTIFINRFIPNEEVEIYFKACDMVCLPYESATQSAVLTMAYGFKKPVLTTNKGGLKEMVVQGKTGLIIQNNEPETIAQASMKILTNEENVNYESNISSFSQTIGYGKLPSIIETILSS